MVGALSFLYLLCGTLAATSARFSASAMRKLCHLALYACVPVTMFLFPEHLATPAQARTMTLWTAWCALRCRPFIACDSQFVFYAQDKPHSILHAD
jgi:hypothetical protein